ncbi:MAG TPA: DUF3500 domain-containing protein [Steroidobacteraceae bacterium]|jgi:hypothetical protein|nr:DUF3500 domain-containing protein [Steroidobacteraceae bacterium]
MRFARTAAIGISLAAGAIGALLLSPNAGAAHVDKPGAVEAAQSFLASLPAGLRATASFPLDSPERTSWYFVPRDRVGVPLLKLDDPQAELLGPLLATALSPEGLLEARGAMKHENILRRIETDQGIDATRRDPGLYYTSVFGTPGTAKPWGWRFEGHHLSLNVTQLPGQPPMVAPLFIGANPAKVPSGLEAGFRLLGAEEDLGRALITMLPEERRKQAMLSDTAFPEIVTGNDPKVRPLALEGLAAADMKPDEQRALRRIIELYTGRVNPASAKDLLARMDHAGFGKVRFGWAGGIEPGQKHYYRVHGPTLLIEYDNTQNDANHVHTVYRDLERDFGGDVLRQHLAADHR